MRRFSGAGGSLYALGERLSFSQPLLDCGDGWDWRAPLELSYWLEPPSVYVDGEHVLFEEVHLRSGRVGLARNMSRGVSAIGACLPISWLCDGERWELHMEATTGDTPVLGSSDAVNTMRILGMTGWLRETEVPISKVLARFPTGESGLFIGVGTAKQVDSDVMIEFDREGVEYGLG